MNKMPKAPYYFNAPMHNMQNVCSACKMYPCPYSLNQQMYGSNFPAQFDNPHMHFANNAEYDSSKKLKDYGPEPFVVNINEASVLNNNFRTTLWTGKHLQLTLMSIRVGEDIGLEIHPHLDQFIRIEEGQGIVRMGDRKDRLDFQRKISDDFAIIIPAGTWHNIINTGNKPLKLYSIYAPPQHPKGTIHKTKADAEAAE